MFIPLAYVSSKYRVELKSKKSKGGREGWEFPSEKKGGGVPALEEIMHRKKSTFTENKELHNFNDYFKMNKITNKFLLTEDKFMPELHLKQPGFTYSACGPFTKHCERIQKFRETGDLNIYIDMN